jgi:hypothetical protein
MGPYYQGAVTNQRLQYVPIERKKNCTEPSPHDTYSESAGSAQPDTHFVLIYPYAQRGTQNVLVRAGIFVVAGDQVAVRVTTAARDKLRWARGISALSP